MKYLIIAGLVSVIFVLVYARVRPYLKLMQKVVQSFSVVTEINTSAAAAQQKTPSKNKLIRCDSCGTWIPAERAMTLNSGLATFCSAECMAKEPSQKRKLAG